MIIVYHNKNFTDYSFTQPDEIEQDLLVKAAEVDSDDLNKAFELTNNIDHAWTENEGVTPSGLSQRSTSVGDVMEIDGQYHMVASCGFKDVKLS